MGVTGFKAGQAKERLMKKLVMILALAGLVVPTIAVPAFGADEPAKKEEQKGKKKAKKKGQNKKEEQKEEQKKPS